MATKKQDAPAMTRESFEALFGGGFENVPGRAGVRTNGDVFTFGDNDECACLRGDETFYGDTWADVARKMKVK